MIRFLFGLGLAASLMAGDAAESAARLALAAPPEFGADALLRLVESGRISGGEAAAEAIQQAFDLGARAGFRSGMKPKTRIAPDTRQATLARAHGLKLDALALQSRAVTAMAAVDGGRARQMYIAMAKPELAPLPCSGFFDYDVAGQYRALGSVMQRGFTAKERAREDHVAFLVEAVGAVHAASEVEPMRAAIEAAGLTAQQKDLAMARFVAPAAGGKCTEEAAKLDAYWESATAQRIVGAAKRLRFSESGGRMLSVEERGAPEWAIHLADLEKELAGWEPGAEKSEADYYQQKCTVYQALVELIPAGPDRDRVLRSFAAFVAGSNLQSQTAVEWFAPVAGMLERVRNTNQGEPEKVLAAYEGSGNPVLGLYAALERLMGSAVPSWIWPGSSSWIAPQGPDSNESRPAVILQHDIR